MTRREARQCPLAAGASLPSGSLFRSRPSHGPDEAARLTRQVDDVFEPKRDFRVGIPAIATGGQNKSIFVAALARRALPGVSRHEGSNLIES
jgi:hypothetical protein